MRLRLSLLVASLALAVLPACAAETSEEETGSTDEALTASWAELDEDLSPPSNAEIDRDSDEADAEDDAREVEEGDGQEDLVIDGAPAEIAAPAITAPPPRPGSCVASTSLDLLVYYELRATDLLASLKAHAKPCSRYFVAIPKVGGSAKDPNAQLQPRRVNGLGVHAFGPHFVATAEFHWGGSRQKGTNVRYPGWKNVEVVKDDAGVLTTRVIPRAKYFRVSWYLKGVLFRQRMAKRGYRPQAGDTWHVNELESMWVRSQASQKAIRDLVRGLADGDPSYDAATDKDPEVAAKSAAEKAEITKATRMSGVRGVLYIAANGKRRPGETTNAGIDADVKQTLRHKRFWGAMASYVDFWGQERYVTPESVCNMQRSLPDQADAVASSLEDFPLTASRAPRFKSGKLAGQSTVGTALFYLGRNYVPVINAAWTNEALPGAVMRDFVAAEVHAARSFANDHRYSDGRIGVYFRPKRDESIANKPALVDAENAENVRLADRTALSLNGAYDGAAGNALAACGSAGAEGCRCAR